MAVDAATTRRIAHLARIAVKDEEVAHLTGEINAVLAFVEQLAEVDDGGIADDIVANAPATEGHFFLVPKVVE
jgi:aspartyl-tRNA(Asn)/glutamyl-tRNA(Gln) amidotransferase subunit C